MLLHDHLKNQAFQGFKADITKDIVDAAVQGIFYL
jgi:hypothetical protein